MTTPYKGIKVWGPYIDKYRSRRFVHIKLPDGTKETVLYSRYLMEVHLGRYLKTEEHVHHINEDQLDDRLENFEVLTEHEHHRLHGLKYKDNVVVNCVLCNKEITMGPRQQATRTTKGNSGMAGPFCSNSCIATYTWQKRKRLRNGKPE